jgi:hypothetical protein
LSGLRTVRWRIVAASSGCAGPTFCKAMAVDILGKGVHKSIRGNVSDFDHTEQTAHRGHEGVLSTHDVTHQMQAYMFSDAHQQIYFPTEKASRRQGSDGCCRSSHQLVGKARTKPGVRLVGLFHRNSRFRNSIADTATIGGRMRRRASSVRDTRTGVTIC